MYNLLFFDERLFERFNEKVSLTLKNVEILVVMPKIVNISGKCLVGKRIFSIFAVEYTLT